MLHSSICQSRLDTDKKYYFNLTHLFPFFDLDFEKFMDGFFVTEGVHDRQINNTAEVNKIGLCSVFNSFLFGDS